MALNTEQTDRILMMASLVTGGYLTAAKPRVGTEVAAAFSFFDEFYEGLVLRAGQGSEPTLRVMEMLCGMCAGYAASGKAMTGSEASSALSFYDHAIEDMEARRG